MSAAETIDTLRAKVGELIARCAELSRNLDDSFRNEQKLKKENQLLRLQTKSLDSRIKELEVNFDKELLKNSFGSAKQISDLMREIDKCIDLVNYKN